MKRAIAAALVLVSLSACGVRNTDAERLERVVVDGEECVVVRDGFGRVIAVDCNWSDR